MQLHYWLLGTGCGRVAHTARCCGLAGDSSFYLLFLPGVPGGEGVSDKSDMGLSEVLLGLFCFSQFKCNVPSSDVRK